jgi:hypothetical protein
MRNVRVSKTALDQLNALLAQGIEPFGVRIVAEKRDRVYATIEHVLAAFPQSNGRIPTWDFAFIRSLARRSWCFTTSTIPNCVCISFFIATPICATSIQDQSSGSASSRALAHRTG